MTDTLKCWFIVNFPITRRAWKRLKAAWSDYPLMDKDKLVELVERCETASGPHRGIDCQIIAAIEGVSQTCVETDAAPIYTRSLDAAMMLVPEGARPIEILHEAIDACGSAAQLFGDQRDAVFSKRLPLFICAAALRSHAPK